MSLNDFIIKSKLGKLIKIKSYFKFYYKYIYYYIHITLIQIINIKI